MIRLFRNYVPNAVLLLGVLDTVLLLLAAEADGCCAHTRSAWR